MSSDEEHTYEEIDSVRSAAALAVGGAALRVSVGAVVPRRREAPSVPQRLRLPLLAARQGVPSVPVRQTMPLGSTRLAVRTRGTSLVSFNRVAMPYDMLLRKCRFPVLGARDQTCQYRAGVATCGSKEPLHWQSGGSGK